MTDPLAPIADLPGVAEAAQKARDGLGQVHRHPANRRDRSVTGGEAALRAARASAMLDGAKQTRATSPDEIDDPILSGALRVYTAMTGESLDAMVGVWRRAPLQVLARLHVLAASDLVDDPELLGRPREGVGSRLGMLADLVTGGTTVAAPIVAAVVHGELASLQPFGVADGVLARAASRLVCVASGLDPHNLGVPEVFWLKTSVAYRSGLTNFASGSPDGVGNWVIAACGGLEAGAREAMSIADTAQANKSGQKQTDK